MSIRRHFLFLDHHCESLKVNTYGHIPADGAPQPQHLPGQEPPHEANALGALVVAGHGDVDELGRRVDIAQSHDGDVGIGGFSHWLVVSPSDGEKSRVEGNRKETRVVEMFSNNYAKPGVADKKQPWLPESCLDLVGEGSRGETASNRGTANISLTHDITF